MSRSAVACAALVLLGALWLSPQAGAAKKPRIASASQSSILARGVTVILRGKAKGKGKRKVKVSASSSTFDDPEPAKLARRRVVRLRGKRKKIRLRLTAAGRAELASCEARTLLVRAGRKVGRASLVRDTASCAPKPIDLSRASECDFIGQQEGSRCLLPFPSDYNTVADSSSPTGRRLALSDGAMPASAGGTPIQAADYNASDGYSQGATLLARVPGLDNPAALAATDAVPINHLGRYAEPDAPVVVIDAATGERQPIWVELDSNAGSADATLLQVHPAVNFEPGHRYIAAFRDLRTASGDVIPAPEGFRYFRDQLPASASEVNSRRDHFESLFRRLRDSGIRRSDLYLAWDFTVASDENNSRRMLQIRDDAFGVLGDDDLSDLTVEGSAPAFSVSSVDTFTPAQNAEIARRVRGTFTVPCYLQPSCAPGGSFDLDGRGLPQRNGDYQANFDCIIPRVAVEGPDPQPLRASTYGHGLFGSAGEVFGSSFQRELANDYGFVFCATDEIGMSNGDLPNTTGIISDLSRFRELADRLQQGLLNGLFLGRLMIHPDGLSSSAAFRVDGTTGTPSVIDTDELYYVGASQGGIFGGALTAVAPDFTRSALNVPAMNYSVLLPRSIDYDPFAALMSATYTDAMSRPLILSLIQMLWDRGEPNGYAHRMTSDPLPGTPAHKVLMQVALGDHQVTNFQADVEARTIGAATHVPILDPGRWPDVDVLWNVPAITSYPYDGSAILYGDIGPVRPNPSPPPATIGVPPPPLENVPNREGEDPHGAPRGAPLAALAISGFLAPGGALQDVCGPSPCYAGGYTGPP